MDLGSWIFIVILSGVLVFVIGHSFIDSFFDRKEGLISQMVELGKGEQCNG